MKKLYLLLILSLFFSAKTHHLLGQTITPTPNSLSSFTTTSGTASVSLNFDLVDGMDLSSDDVIVTAPTNFEVSSDDVSFGNTATYTPQGPPGSSFLPAGLDRVYVRITNSAPIGSVSGDISITGGGLSSPVTISLSGTVSAAAAEINVKVKDGADIANNGNAPDFGSVTIGNSADLVLTIQNTGTANLTITSIVDGGSGASSYSIEGTIPTTVAAGGEEDITVRFTPLSAGATPTAFVTISNDDADEGTYIINLSSTGVATAPEINVKVKDGADIANNGNAANFGNVNVGNNTDVTYTIQNTGTATLSISDITTTGEFALQGSKPTSVAANSETDITVRFSPTSVGAKAGTFVVTNNDSDESNYTVNLAGTGTEATSTTNTIKPIREAVDANGLPTTSGSAQVKGIVYGVNTATDDIELTIIEGTNAAKEGINIFIAVDNFTALGIADKNAFEEGDELSITGTVGDNNGLMRISIDGTGAISENSTGNTLQSASIVTALDEDSESRLVKLENIVIKDATEWKGSSSNTEDFTFTVVENATGTELSIYIDSDTELATKSFSELFTLGESGVYSIEGIGSQFDDANPRDSGYRLAPWKASQVVNTGIFTAIAIEDIQVKDHFYPNPTSNGVSITNEGVVSLTIVNNQGAIVAKVAGNKVDMSDLATGIYTVIALDNQGGIVSSQSIIKQ